MRLVLLGHAIGSGLVISLVVGSAIGLVLWVALRLLEHRSAWGRYSLCCGALVLVLGSLVQSWDGIRSAYGGHDHKVEMLAVELMESGSPDPTGSLPGGWHAEELALAVESLHDHDVEPTVRGAEAAKYGVALALFAAFWVVGALWNLTGLGHALLRIRGMRQRARRDASLRWQRALHRVERRLCIRWSIRLAVSEEVDGPVLVGWWKPMILLPPGPHDELSDVEIEAVLAHEVAHVRRGDYLVNVIQMVIEAVLFYHPVARWIGSRIRDEREYCSDDIAHRTATGSLSDYLRALATLEEWRLGLEPDPALAASGRSLLMRIRRLVSMDRLPRPRWDREVGIVVVGLMILWGPSGMIPRQAQGAALTVMKHDLSMPKDYEAIAERHGLTCHERGEDR